MTNTTNKSFIIHKDSLSVLKKLSKPQKADLFDAIADYQLDGKLPEDNFISIVFEPFLNQFKRDQERYNNIIERNKINGSKGGRPKNPVGYLETQENPEEPKKAYSDSKSDSDSKKDKEKKLLSNFEKFYDLYDYKKARPKALDAFKKALEKDTFENILAGVNAYISSRGSEKKYWKHPTSWLNAEAWKDEYITTAKTEKDICQELNKLVGKDWFREIEVTDTQATFTISKENYELLKALDQSLKDQISNKIKTELQVLTIRPKYL